MKGSGRLIILLLLLALGLHNFISSRILNAALDSLTHSQENKIKLISELITQDLSHQEDSTIAGRLQSISEKHHLDVVAVFDQNKILQACYPAQPPKELIPVLENQRGLASGSGPQQISDYHVQWIQYPGKEGVYGLLIAASADRLFQVQRSTKILGFLNLVILAFAALLGFYFIESTIKPFRVLMQTAKTAQPNIPVEGTRNEADFLIATFKGVIARLKEKELELGRLHRTEKARADDVQQLNQDLLQSISSGLIIIDKSGTIQIFNQAAQTILQLSPILAMKKPYDTILSALSSQLIRDIEHCLIDQAGSSHPEMEINLPNGESRFLSMNVMPLRDRQQAFAGALCIFTDVTENTLLRQHMAQKEKFASLGEMAAGLAHEFRNSLSTVTGYVQMLENRMQQDQLSYVLPIQKELNVLQKVVNDFLSFAKPLSMRLSKVDLGEMLKECVEEAQISAPGQRIQFIQGGEFPVITGDESLLRQAFTNLIRNAVESIDGKSGQGKIVIHGTLHKNGKLTAIEISDNGSGIEPGNISRIFAPFFTTKERGVGLGLAIVQKVILQHNGTISAESSQTGSVFRAHLPVTLEPPITGT